MNCRGYGKSDKLHDTKFYTPNIITDDCISVLDAIGVDKVHLYSGSRGANIALLLAKYHPERFFSYSIFDAEIYDNVKQYPGVGNPSISDNLYYRK
jgi:pimeloyl-ACP methyl ester carboxylesterase